MAPESSVYQHQRGRAWKEEDREDEEESQELRGHISDHKQKAEGTN